MAILKTNTYTPNLFFKNKHFNTLYRYFKTKIKINFVRERMQTADGDFIDLDISSVQSPKLIIALHGLEGSSDSSYIRSLTLFANTHNYDVVAMNYRGCSGVPNVLLSSYHSGKTDDLLAVINYMDKKQKYDEINLVGYSLGGNILLKFMGEPISNFPKIIKSAVAVSAPCDLKCSALTLDRFWNRIYRYNFLKTLKEKARQKMLKFPDAGLDKSKILKAGNFEIFDTYFTALTHGFKDADDYWQQSSSKQFITDIKVRSLLISALDDPFLSASCYPFKEAKEHKYFDLLTHKHGGHIGFYTGFRTANNYWLEKQILLFIAAES